MARPLKEDVFWRFWRLPLSLEFIIFNFFPILLFFSSISEPASYKTTRYYISSMILPHETIKGINPSTYDTAFTEKIREWC